MEKIVQRHKNPMGKENPIYKEKSVSECFTGTRLEIHKDAGQGWMEFLKIDNGMDVGLVNYNLKNQRKGNYTAMNVEPFQLNILLSGCFDFKVDSKPKQRLCAGDVWFCHGDYEKAFFTEPANKTICGIALTLPSNLIDAWLGNCEYKTNRAIEKFINTKSKQHEKINKPCFHIGKGLQKTSTLIHVANTLIISKHSTFYDKLQFESLALDLLYRILTLKSDQSCSDQGRTRQIRIAIDEAIDILRLEWEKPPTISTLARQVGLNECYLKKGFRQHLGLSIGEYVRKLRMTKAMEMIETKRYSVLETALNVGYSNPSHFSAAFKSFYGKVPSYYIDN